MILPVSPPSQLRDAFEIAGVTIRISSMLLSASQSGRSSSSRVSTVVLALALVAIGVLSRLPQLHSPNLMLDGDECVVGLMARHVVHGHELPIFFWGQRYALSTVEALAGALALATFGTSAWPLKAAMLALWIVGTLFLFSAQSVMIGRRRSFWLTLVFLLHPAWAVWSMKARGGYLTAFGASAMLLWLVARKNDRETMWMWVVGGVLAATIFLAQPLWLPGLAPILIMGLASRRRVVPAVAFLVTAIGCVLMVTFTAPSTPVAWGGPALGNPDMWGTGIRMVQQIYVSATGSYYLGWAIEPPGPATTWVAIGSCALLAALAAIQLVRLIASRYNRWSHALFAGVCATIAANWTLLFARDARYLLPLAALVVALTGVEIADLIDRYPTWKRAFVAITTVVLLLESTSLWEFRHFNFLWANPPGSWSEMRRMQQMLNALTTEGVRYVFSMNGLLDTQIIFYSDEQVISRSASANDRHPAYVRAVGDALARGERVAVVGYTNASGAPGCWDVPICTGGIERIVRDPEAILTIDGKYFVYAGADKRLLSQLHFELPD
jgi:hypothetical protein